MKNARSARSRVPRRHRWPDTNPLASRRAPLLVLAALSLAADAAPASNGVEARSGAVVDDEEPAATGWSAQKPVDHDLAPTAVLRRAKEEVVAVAGAWGVAPGVPRERLLLWGGATSGAVPQLTGAGGLVSVGVSYRALSFLAPEIVAGAGGYSGVGHVTQRFSFGLKLILPLDQVRPFLWGAYAHIHEATLADARADPVGVLTTSDEAGVHHRSGLEVGGGVLFPVHAPSLGEAPIRLDICLRVSGVWVPDIPNPFSDDALPDALHHGYAQAEVLVGVPVPLPFLSS